MSCNAGPSASVSTVRNSTPAPAPMRAGRPPRVVPTASTIVSASTNSTSDARNAATTTVPTCAQLMATRRPSRPPPGRRSPTALPRHRATPLRRRRPWPSRRHLDRRHHALVLVRQEVAVVHEPADDHRIGEGDDHLHFAAHRDVDDILVPLEPLRRAVHLGDLKMRLVYVEVVQLAGLVPDGPFLDRAELDAGVGPARVERAAVDEERVPVLHLGKHDGTTAGDCTP